jgi:hypothetical protein
MEILNGFKKEFSIKNIENFVSDDEKNVLFEISLVRNLVIHNNGIVNRIHKEQLKKFLKDKVKYKFDEGDTVLNKLDDLVQDVKDISTKLCEKMTNAIINESKRLEKYHEEKKPNLSFTCPRPLRSLPKNTLSIFLLYFQNLPCHLFRLMTIPAVR